MSSLAPGLLAAYRAAHYQVRDGAGSFTLKVGRRSAELASLMTASGYECVAFITACNPYSQPLDVQQNRFLQLQLEQELRRQGYELLPGVGFDPTGEWPGEESLLVLGMELSHARQTGQRYRQNALIWADTDAIPQLITLL